MGIFIQDPSHLIPHILYKTALFLAVSRYLISWALQFITSPNSDQIPSSPKIRDSLATSTFEDVKERLPWVSDTCAVCLGQLADKDEVRELRNCCHVFHTECIDRWVEHDGNEDNHRSCPLCRAPLVTSSQGLCWAKSEPSWAVERILYLFGDDLLP